MAWVEPNLDNDLYFTAEDMNRICGDINYLDSTAGLREDWTDNDIITLSEWQAVIAAVSSLIDYTGLSLIKPDEDATKDNMNLLESDLLAIYDRFGIIYDNLKALRFTGDGAYAEETNYDYVRGL